VSIFDQLSFDQQLRIDELCGRWERMLIEGTTCAIGDFLQQVSTDSSRRALRTELLLMQLDHIASRTSSLAASETKTSSNPFTAVLENLYQSHPEFAQYPDDFLELVERAFRWSQKCSPGSSVSDFVQCLGQVNGVERTVRHCLAEYWPVILRVDQLLGSFQMPLVYPVTVGRQRQLDPPPPALVGEPATGLRLLVAPCDELRISRHQLRMEVVSRYRIQLTNVSKRSQVLVDEEAKLLAGDVIIRECPVRVRLYNCMIALDRAAPRS
jgi:hypothetical protein